MLDDLAQLRARDPGDMLGRIAEFPEQCAIAWDQAADPPLPDSYRDVTAVIILGMGGSAIGGDLVRALTEDTARVPIVTQRDYHAPAWVGPTTLAIAASYSGSTEETISALRHAIAAGAKPLALTTGNQVAAIVREAGGPVVPVTYRSSPRAALAHLFLPLLRVLGRLGLVADYSADLAAALPTLRQLRDQFAPETPEASNPAKQYARWFAGGFPAVFAAGHLAPVGLRFKGQVNENAKHWALFEPIPEMNHNLVVGFPLPAPVVAQMRVVLLDSPLSNPRNRARVAITKDLLDRAGVAHRTF
ncbi:MAG: bifunctional phosphoglucose/phosphomannose isomerase, partial [Dehalococcoidia bacterium]|nr:bifunctional phosphoglucose/phosphomannose isomerase [Dehalococcoidia bacterium]